MDSGSHLLASVARKRQEALELRQLAPAISSSADRQRLLEYAAKLDAEAASIERELPAKNAV